MQLSEYMHVNAAGQMQGVVSLGDIVHLFAHRRTRVAEPAADS